MGRRKPAAPCSIEGCESPRIKNGYCNAHNLRFKRYGSATAPRRKAESFATPEESLANKKRLRQQHYQRNKDAYRERVRLWKRANPEAVRAYREASEQTEEGRVRKREYNKRWRLKNVEKERARNVEYKSKNRDKQRANQALRRATLLRAKPSWLTREHRKQIGAIYKEAFRLSAETGVAYQVDHIVPLRGKVVCGLHVPWNLRVITAYENQTRPRVWRDGD